MLYPGTSNDRELWSEARSEIGSIGTRAQTKALYEKLFFDKGIDFVDNRTISTDFSGQTYKKLNLPTSKQETYLFDARGEMVWSYVGKGPKDYAPLILSNDLIIDHRQGQDIELLVSDRRWLSPGWFATIKVVQNVPCLTLVPCYRANKVAHVGHLETSMNQAAWICQTRGGSPTMDATL